jgi:uncharacterized membrane protein (TIGR02234 family)
VTARRAAGPGLGAVVALVVAAAAGLLVSTAGAWVTGVLERPAPLPAEALSFDAGDLAPSVRALGLVVLAAAPALLAVRGRSRVAVGVVLLLAGLGAAWTSVGAVLDPVAALPAGAVPDGTTADVAVTARPYLALAAAVGTVLVGALVVARGGRWPALGRRYEAPAAQAEGRAADAATPAEPVATTDPPAAAVDGASAWEALDRGEDPTGT